LSATLVVMTKAPIPGMVKTRLSPPLSMALCADLHEAFLRDTVRKATSLPDAHCVLAYAPDSGLSFFKSIIPDGCELILQEGDDLGERMLNCFKRFHSSCSPIVVIGSDSPTLPVCYIRTAIDFLDLSQNDVVFGPTSDGGYYLIGMTGPHTQLFADMEWSTSWVLRTSINRCVELGLRWSLLPEWYDVDTPNDLARLADELCISRENSTAAPHTSSLIHSLLDDGALNSLPLP